MNSTILNCSEISQLKELCKLRSNWNLLYRERDHGFKIRDLNKRCKGESPTMMIIKTTENYVFGGYTKANWTCDYGWVPDKSAFIFSLFNKLNKPQFMEIRDSGYATMCYIQKYLTFGFDIFIMDSSNTNTNSFSEF